MKLFNKALFPQAAVSQRMVMLSFYLSYRNDMNTLVSMREPVLKEPAKALPIFFAPMLKKHVFSLEHCLQFPPNLKYMHV